MTRKQILILAGLVLFVALVSIFGINSKKNTKQNEPSTVVASTTIKDVFSPVSTSTFTSEIPKDAVETKPKYEAPVVGKKGENQGSLGIFELTASESGYEPSVLTIVKGNVVELTFFSKGGNFDFFVPDLGVYLSAFSGEKKTSSFRSGATGTFRFECRDFCPQGKKIEGMLIVLPE
ncbi:MAG: hypothetical protein WCV80_03360 [Candidatus Paceibacterota bacterium]|jgi:heme/copper-type cytochrome/quinol oxidase subunit 2